MEAKDIMKARIDLMHVNPGVIRTMLGLERQVRQAGLDHALLDLVRMRARTVKPNSGSMASTRGARRRTTRRASAPRWSGPRR